jgi:hypothetical protein
VGVVRDKWWEEQSPQLSLPTRAQMPEDGSARGALNGLPPTNNSRTTPLHRETVQRLTGIVR